MKELLAVIPLLLCGVVAEAPAPYPPSGFRPAGPAFELPQKNTQQQQEYLPPVEPQRPQPPGTSYGTPEEDVSVQGLPTLEQRPIFQVSPINGQEYVGPNFNSDIRNLDDSYRQAQYQVQQERYREFERQRQAEIAQARIRANVTPQVPRQFVTESTVSTTEPTSTRNPDDFRTTESSTELDLNEGETLDDKKSDDKKDKVTVEVSKQKLQEYPGELFLSSLAQLQLQPQFIPFQQLGQIRAPIYFQPIQQEPSQKQVAGYDAQTHFAALPSVLAQQQYLQTIQNQGFAPNPALLVARQQEPANVGFAPQNIQPVINTQYQPAVAQVPQNYPEGKPVVVQPQTTKEEAEEDDEQNNQQQPQFVYQQSYQPQDVIYQPPQPQPQSQGQQNVFLPQAQLVNYPNLVQQYQNPTQQIRQPQTAYAQPQLINPQQYQNGYVQQQFVDQNQFQNTQQQVQIPQQVYQDQQQFQNTEPQVQIPQQVYQDQQQYQNTQQQVQIPQQVYQDQQQFQNTQQQVQIPQQFYQNPQVQNTQQQVQPQQVYQNQQFQYTQQQVQMPQQVYQDQQQFLNAQQVQFPQQVYQNQQPFPSGQQQAQIPQYQGQDSLQSGLDINQQGNGVDQNDKEESDDDNTEDDGATSIAVATAFGARTQPRMFTRYGAPVPVPRQSANPQAADTDEQSPEDSGAVAEANAFASGRRKSAKLRSRKVRPLFTLDRSGHLVLAQEQN